MKIKSLITASLILLSGCSDDDSHEEPQVEVVVDLLGAIRAGLENVLPPTHYTADADGRWKVEVADWRSDEPAKIVCFGLSTTPACPSAAELGYYEYALLGKDAVHYTCAVNTYSVTGEVTPVMKDSYFQKTISGAWTADTTFGVATNTGPWAIDIPADAWGVYLDCKLSVPLTDNLDALPSGRQTPSPQLQAKMGVELDLLGTPMSFSNARACFIDGSTSSSIAGGC